MFLQRLISSIVLIPLVLILLFYAPVWFLTFLVFGLTLACGLECVGLIPLVNTQQILVFLSMLFLGVVGGFYFFHAWLFVGILAWIFVFWCIISYPKSQKYWGHSYIVALLSLLFISLFVQCLVRIYSLSGGAYWLVYLFGLVWAADVGAYITGKLFGTHKLVPQLSPGKSWEGIGGGVLLSFLVSWVAVSYVKPQDPVYWFVLGLIIVKISIFGDLFISMLKRRRNMKDTGALIPGHGGILDRLDSMIAAAPFFYLGCRLMGY